MLYAVIKGMPIKQMVRYAAVLPMASVGVDIAETIGRTSTIKTAISVMDTAIKSVT